MTAWLRILSPLLIYLVCTLSAAFLGYRYAAHEGDLGLERLRLEYNQRDLQRAKAAEADAKAATQHLQQEQARGDQLAADLATEKDQRRQTTDRLIGEIARVNDLYRAALDAPPEPLPACVFTTGFVRVWNEANGTAVAVPAQPSASGAADSASGAGTPDDLAAAGIGRAEILTNHVRNAEKCSVVRHQLNLLIDWNTHGRD